MALHYVLKNSVQARAAIQTLARTVSPTLPELTHFGAQSSISVGMGRPDLCGWSADKIVLTIEDKLWAGLTEHQPVSYVRRLPREGLLLFIAPKQRIVPLRLELAERLRNSDLIRSEDVDWQSVARDDVVWHTTLEGASVALLDWRNLLIRLRRAIENDSNSIVNSSDIDQIQGFCDAVGMSAPEFNPFRSEQLSSRDIPPLHISLETVVNAAVERFKDLEFETPDEWKEKQTWNYGFASGFKDIKFWFGIYENAWAIFGTSPLWLEITTQDKHRGKLHRAISWFMQDKSFQPFEMENEKNSWYVPILLESMVSKEGGSRWHHETTRQIQAVHFGCC